MKTIYNKYNALDTGDPCVQNILRNALNSVRESVKYWSEQGYNPRQMRELLCDEIYMITSEQVVRKASEMHKEEKKNRQKEIDKQYD